MAGINCKELDSSTLGGPYDEPWTDEPTPPYVLCPECGEPLHTELDYFNKEWEYSCHTLGCGLAGHTWTEEMVNYFHKTYRKAKHAK